MIAAQEEARLFQKAGLLGSDLNSSKSGVMPMSENEFELYLSLLSRFLRLKSSQRGEIADELPFM